jgi:hypothetical protein
MPTGYPKKDHPEMYGIKKAYVYKTDEEREAEKQDKYTDHADFEYALEYVNILIKRFKEGKIARHQLLAFMEDMVQVWTGAE